MSNEPQTYHLLVTLDNTPGEAADGVVQATEDFLRKTLGWREHATVVHLTPETLPDRYIERPAKFWTLTHIADWEGGTTVYSTRERLVQQVESDFAEACERAGDDIATARLHDDDPDPASKSLDSMASYVQENGWKVHHYLIESHTFGELVST